jgi:pimeloyl-ACP methyl ester carboxylesterase
VSAPGWETPPLEPDEYRPRMLAGLVVALLDVLERERAAFVGFSWGASIGVHLAAAHWERLSALVLLDAGYTDLQDQPGFVEQSREELLEAARASSRAPSASTG